MKIRVKVGDLVEQITQTAITIDRKAPDMPSSKVYLRALKRQMPGEETTRSFLYLFSTDQASKTFIKLEIESTEEEGQTLIDPAKLLGGLVGRASEQIVELSVLDDKTKIRMKVGKNVAHLPYDGSVETANATIKSMPKGEPWAKIAAKTLIEFIRRSTFCIPAADNGQQRFAMGVLNLKGSEGSYIAQATDGHIVAWHKAQQTDTTKYDLPSLLVPMEALGPLQKLLQKHKDSDVSLFEGYRNAKGDLQEIFFSMEDVLFGTVLRVGVYPNIAALLEQHDPTFEVNVARDELKGALTRAANFVENSSDRRCVRLTTAGETELKIEASNPLSDLCDELEIALTKGKSKPVTVAVNIDYLLNVTAVQTNEKVIVGFNADRAKALTVRDVSDATLDTRYAMMPILPEKVAAAKKADKKAKGE